MILALLLALACTALPTRDAVFDPDGDGEPWGADCDNTTPSAAESPYDGLDNDCDAATPDDDLDGDSFGFAEDCDDHDPARTPSATDVVGDGVDQNCDDVDGTDADGDGFASRSSGGEDCDDGDEGASPGATELVYNGVDDDCDPQTRDDDLDGDGVNLAEDCDDLDGRVFPAASEDCDDGVVNDCGGSVQQSLYWCGLVGERSLADVDALLSTADASGSVGSALAAGDLTDDGRADIAIGARTANEGGGDSGAVYVVFNRDVATMNVSDGASVTYVGSAGDSAGDALAFLDDVNGDGCGDLAIGAPGNSVAYVVTGCQSGDVMLLSDALLQVVGEEGNLGTSIAPAPDLDGDGLTDLFIGSNEHSGPAGSAAGVVFLMADLAAGGVLSTNDAHVTLTGETAISEAGYGVASGDLNADGVLDGLIGAPHQASPSGDITGAAYVVNGAELTPATISLLNADAVLYGEANGDQTGLSVAADGDVNGDGVADALIGAPYASTGYYGAVYVVYGTNALPGGDARAVFNLVNADARINGVERGDEAGFSVAFVGDADGDSLDDLLIGARNVDSGGISDVGAAYLVLGADIGGVSGLIDAQLKLVGETSGARAGWAVASASDLDLDGFDDLLVGAMGGSKAYVLHTGY